MVSYGFYDKTFRLNAASNRGRPVFKERRCPISQLKEVATQHRVFNPEYLEN